MPTPALPGNPHISLLKDPSGLEEAFADVDVEDGLVVCELGVRGGVRLRYLPPLLSTQLAARKGGEQQNLGLRLARTDLRDDGGVTRDELGQPVAGNCLVAGAGLLQHHELRLIAVELAVLHAPQQAFEARALRAEARGLERSEPLIPHAPAAVRPEPHLGARGPEKDEVDVTGLRSVDEAVVTLSLVRGQQALRGIRSRRPDRCRRRDARRLRHRLLRPGGVTQGKANDGDRRRDRAFAIAAQRSAGPA